jgi:hypothetical protein
MTIRQSQVRDPSLVPHQPRAHPGEASLSKSRAAHHHDAAAAVVAVVAVAVAEVSMAHGPSPAQV